MARFRIEHPITTNFYAVAGHDHALGFFVELFREGRDRPMESLDLFALGKPVTLHDCFQILIEYEFFTGDDLESALAHVQDGTRVPKGLARVIEVIERFKEATT